MFFNISNENFPESLSSFSTNGFGFGYFIFIVVFKVCCVMNYMRKVAGLVFILFFLNRDCVSGSR